MRNGLKKWVALLCAAVILLVSVPVQAADVSSISYADMSVEELIDVILNQQGIFATADVIGEIGVDLLNDVDATIQEYEAQLDALIAEGNILEDAVNTLKTGFAEVGTIGEAVSKYGAVLLGTSVERLEEFLTFETSLVDFVSLMIDDESENGNETVNRGKKIKLDDTFVDATYDKFKVWYSENVDYITVYTRPVTAIIDDFDFHPHKTLLANACSYLVDKYDACIGISSQYTLQSDVQKTIDELFVLPDDSDYFGGMEKPSFIGFDYEVPTITREYPLEATSLRVTRRITATTGYYGENYISMSKNVLNVALENLSTLIEQYYPNDLLDKLYNTVSVYPSFWDEKKTIDPYLDGSYLVTSYSYVYSSEVRRIDITKIDYAPFDIVYYDEPVYPSEKFNPCGDANDVTVTGDYIIDNTTYSYDAINKYITDNSVDTSDNSVVNNYINDASTTIINNQTTSSDTPDSGSDGDVGGGSGDDNDEGFFDRVLNSLGDLLGKILGLLEEVLDVVLSFLLDALGVLVTGLTDALAKLSELMTQVSGIQGFLTAFFSFMPGEYWSIVTSTMLIICVLAIVKFFKR